MKQIIIVCFCFSLFNCTQKKQPLIGDTKFQRELNSEYKDASTSPLKTSDLKNFKGLEFFTFDSTYITKAHLKRTPNTPYFEMKTTTDRRSEERVYGVLTFILNNKTYSLNAYQGKELMLEEGFEDYLFLPFMDNTNGEESYSGGRYIDLRIPESDSLILDFNTAYNPYCAYNKKYSCPIVPEENRLYIDIKAGVKAYKKH